jgi:hypothetical protein
MMGLAGNPDTLTATKRNQLSNPPGWEDAAGPCAREPITVPSDVSTEELLVVTRREVLAIVLGLPDNGGRSATRF